MLRDKRLEDYDTPSQAACPQRETGSSDAGATELARSEQPASFERQEARELLGQEVPPDGEPKAERKAGSHARTKGPTSVVQRAEALTTPDPASPHQPLPSIPHGMVDLRPLKTEFERLLPPWHPNRIAILREPDFLPLAEAVAKAETYLRIAASWEDRG